MNVNEDRSAAIQDEFFHRAKREGGIVTIFLTSGKKLTGRIKGVDRFTLVLESHRIDQLIFKHAVSTVTLGRPNAESREAHAPAPDDAPRAPAASEPPG
jgi:host factor-I protein